MPSFGIEFNHRLEFCCLLSNAGIQFTVCINCIVVEYCYTLYLFNFSFFIFLLPRLLFHFVQFLQLDYTSYIQAQREIKLYVTIATFQCSFLVVNRCKQTILTKIKKNTNTNLMYQSKKSFFEFSVQKKHDIISLIK